MKCNLTLRRLSGKRLGTGRGEIRDRLVSVSLASKDGYRVAKAQCCTGGSEVAVLWEPTLVSVGTDAMVFQGFEKDGEQTVVQEWVVKPYFAGVSP